jgi:hypothetical protein
VIVDKPKRSETRQLTEGVFVRFKPADLDVLKVEADRRGMSVQELLRESTLRTVGAAS